MASALFVKRLDGLFTMRPICAFQLTGYATESNENNIFAVLCERLAVVTTPMN